MEHIRLQSDFLLQRQRSGSLLQLPSSDHSERAILLTWDATFHLCDDWDFLLFFEELQSDKQGASLHKGLHAELIAHKPDILCECVCFNRHSIGSGSILLD